MATLAAPPVSADHEEVRVVEGARSGLTMAVAVHRTVEGRSLGGLRIWSYAERDDAVRDGQGGARPAGGGGPPAPPCPPGPAGAPLPPGGGRAAPPPPPGEPPAGARR